MLWPGTSPWHCWADSPTLSSETAPREQGCAFSRPLHQECLWPQDHLWIAFSSPLRGDAGLLSREKSAKELPTAGLLLWRTQRSVRCGTGARLMTVKVLSEATILGLSRCWPRSFDFCRAGSSSSGRAFQDWPSPPPPAPAVWASPPPPVSALWIHVHLLGTPCLCPGPWRRPLLASRLFNKQTPLPCVVEGHTPPGHPSPFLSHLPLFPGFRWGLHAFSQCTCSCDGGRVQGLQAGVFEGSSFSRNALRNELVANQHKD